MPQCARRCCCVVGKAGASSLRVIVADDDASVRDNVRRALAEITDLELVGTARDGAEAWNLVLQLQPDVLVLDDAMPIANGLDVASRLRTELPMLRIVMYVSAPENCLEAASIGAAACISKGRPLEELLAALRGSDVEAHQ
jgi:DNA-binding NarL/FixJ family response regulator